MHQPREGETRDCPCCGGVAVFSMRTAVVERDGKVYKDMKPGPHSRYSKGWSCSNGTCDFSEELPMEVPS